MKRTLRRRTAVDFWKSAAELGQRDALDVAHDLESGVRKLLKDCYMTRDVVEAAPAPDLEPILDLEEVVEEDTEEERAPAPAPALPAPHDLRRRAAIRLVTQIETRARARGFDVDGTPVRADHAIALVRCGEPFCTVSALDGDVYVDGTGPAPQQRVPLTWDPEHGMFAAAAPAEWAHPAVAIELEIALLMRAARARSREPAPLELAAAE